MDEVNEAKIFGARLISASKSLKKYCDGITEQFVQCGSDHDNPKYCSEIGKEVIKCSQKVFSKISLNCYNQWVEHSECLRRENMDFSKCRAPNSDSEQKFHSCLSKYGV